MTRLNTNARLQYNPGRRETPIEGIGGMYRFWKSIGSDDRNKLVELFEIGHQNPSDETQYTSQMDWESLAKQQPDAYENGYNGPVELMAKGWDYALADRMKDHTIETPAEYRVDEPGIYSDETSIDSETPSFDYAARREPADDQSFKAAEAARAHARAENWRVGNDNRWRVSVPAMIAGKPLTWPTAPYDYETREEY